MLALLVTGTTPGWIVALPLALYGLGLGLASAQLTGTVLSEIPVGMSGQGSATQSTIRQIGSAIGTAVSGAVLSAALAMTLPSSLHDVGVSGATATQLAEATRSSAGTTITQLRATGGTRPFGAHTDQVVGSLARGFAEATRWSLLIAVVFLGSRGRGRGAPSERPRSQVGRREAVTWVRGFGYRRTLTDAAIFPIGFIR